MQKTSLSESSADEPRCVFSRRAAGDGSIIDSLYDLQLLKDIVEDLLVGSIYAHKLCVWICHICCWDVSGKLALQSVWVRPRVNDVFINRVISMSGAEHYLFKTR